jgi:hypothetical protein
MVQLQTYTKAIKVQPSDYCNIPNPSLRITDQIAVSIGGGLLTTTSADFVALGVKVGDIVYITSGGGLTDNGATVLSIQSSSPSSPNDTLEINNAAYSGAGDSFTVYAGDQNDASKSGCVLLFPSGITPSGNIVTKMGDTISLAAFGTVTEPYLLPIQVTQYKSDGSRDTIALW